MEKEELLKLYNQKVGKFQEKKYAGILIISLWIGALAFGFAIWLKGWFIGTDLVYQPKGNVTTLSTLKLAKYLFTVSLFAVAGNIAQNVYNLFGKFWQIEALGDQLKIAEEDDKAEIEDKVGNLLNSSSTNITFFRPLFFPMISGILAIPIIFLIYGLNADLPRIIVVSFLTGIIGHVVLAQLQSKTKSFIEALFSSS